MTTSEVLDTPQISWSPPSRQQQQLTRLTVTMATPQLASTSEKTVVSASDVSKPATRAVSTVLPSSAVVTTSKLV